jgi:tRNA 2-selenouridine synthase
MTGSGKTNVLRELKKQGEQVIDLEDLAQHQGSAYGSMGKLIQPTQEQFENNLASVLQKMDNRERLWLEDESITIGKRVIPNPLWIQMRAAEVIKLVVPIKERIQFLVDEYGSLDQDFLIACTQQISKRLGPEQTKSALLAIEENRMSDFIRWVLVYYDKTYQIGQNARAAARVYEIKCEGTDASKNAVLILEKTRKINLESNLTE